MRIAGDTQRWKATCIARRPIGVRRRFRRPGNSSFEASWSAGAARRSLGGSGTPAYQARQPNIFMFIESILQVTRLDWLRLRCGRIESVFYVSFQPMYPTIIVSVNSFG